MRERAEEHPERVFTTLHHLIDLEHLEEAYRRTRKDAAAGVDRVTAEEYEADLLGNLADLLRRVHEGRYRAQPVRRVWIEKEDGKQRPLGIPVLEDKILQRAVVMVLECIYEADFFPCSYGFRPGRSPHQALVALREGCMAMPVSSVLDADVSSFFDEIDHAQLNRFLDRRVGDGVIRRLINKWLRAGIMEGAEITYPDSGTPQGGVISPLLANVYLHYVVDEWFEKEVKPRLCGRSFLIRFADDFVIVFEDAGDAERVHQVLSKRFAKLGLRIHPEKTRLVAFRRPSRSVSRRPEVGTVDFLGLTHYWSKARSGYWVIKRKTMAKRIRRTLRRWRQWCRRNRHGPVHEQHWTLSRKLRGHYGYYGVRGNYKMLEVVYERVIEMWRHWLGRRTRAGYISAARFQHFLDRYPLPKPRIVHAF